MDGGRDRLGAAFLIKSSVDVFRVPINFFLHRREATEQKPILKRCYSAVGRPDVNKIACIGASIGRTIPLSHSSGHRISDLVEPIWSARLDVATEH